MATWGSTRRGCLGMSAERPAVFPVDGNRALTPILYHSPMPRVPLAEFEPALNKKLEELWGTPPNLYRALGNHPRLVAAWAEFSRVLRHEARTPRALRELAILRGAQLTRWEYEWAQHLPMARKAGVREAQISSLSQWRTSAEFDAREKAALA